MADHGTPVPKPGHGRTRLRHLSRSGRRRGAVATLAALAVGVTGALGACSSSGGQASSSAATKKLEVMSWWTSPSEHTALEVLFTDFSKQNPGVAITNGAVAGGAGSNVQIVLATRLQSGNPPDVWQTFPGASIHQYIDSGRLADVSSVYAQDGLKSAMPAQVVTAVSRGGKEYGVPTGAHRGNVLWFNTKVLAKAGVTVPTSGYTSSAFVSDLAKLKSAGVTPLCLGGQDSFTTAELFENILLSVVGDQGWAKVTADKFDWNGPQAKQALSEFAKVLSYADPAGGALTWDQATKKLAAGGCAFETLNDSAYGELRRDGVNEGTGFGYTLYPGTSGDFVAVMDTFVVAQGAKDSHNALAFLATIGSKQTQLAFSKVKGSTPIRDDVDVSSLPPYQRAAAAAFHHDKVLLSIVHGEAMSPAFEEGFYDAVAAFARSKDANAFSSTLREAVNENGAPAH